MTSDYVAEVVPTVVVVQVGLRLDIASNVGSSTSAATSDSPTGASTCVIDDMNRRPFPYLATEGCRSLKCPLGTYEEASGGRRDRTRSRWPSPPTEQAPIQPEALQAPEVAQAQSPREPPTLGGRLARQRVRRSFLQRLH